MSIYQTITDLKDEALGTTSAKSGEEPRSGFQGEGTADDPYDQGNVEQPAESGEEPPSGIQGKGTATDPYDAGNAPENVEPSLAPGQEPPSGIEGKGTATDPYDGGNAPENPKVSDTPTATTSAQSTESPIHPNADSGISSAPKTAAGDPTETRGRDTMKAPPRPREEADVSPGTLPDGSHAQTSGDRGENYEPGKLSRLKGKLTFGRH